MVRGRFGCWNLPCIPNPTLEKSRGTCWVGLEKVDHATLVHASEQLLHVSNLSWAAQILKAWSCGVVALTSLWGLGSSSQLWGLQPRLKLKCLRSIRRIRGLCGYMGVEESYLS